MAQNSEPARWWETAPTVKVREGRQGRIVSPAGRSTQIPCPKCGAFPVVYNGNYFCDGWDFPAFRDCDWALAHPAVSRRDREFCDLVGIDHS